MAQTTSPADDAPIRVSLHREESPDGSEFPYRRANLTVQYDSTGSQKPDVIRCITIRSTRGGPTMLFNITIPPQAPARNISVSLPAMSAEDSYTVRLLAGKTAISPLVAEFNLTIDWPAEMVTAQAFLDPEAYDDGDYLPPVWSNRTLQNVFAAATLACVLLGASILIRRPAWRIAIACVTVIAAGAGLWLAASLEPTVVRQTLGDDERLLLVSCLRDTRFEIPEPHSVPLYYNMDEMSQDEGVIHMSGKLLVSLKSGEVRLFGRRTATAQPTTRPSGI
jgi:hypothetical protein